MYYNIETNFLQEFPVPTGPEWRLVTVEDIERVRNPPPTAASIAARRYDAEISGIHLSGLEVNTDDRSKLLINGAALEATIDPTYVMQWKTTSGFVELNATQVIGIARAVRAHVQACFNREAELLAALEAGTITASM
jgi:hypothetical protein